MNILKVECEHGKVLYQTKSFDRLGPTGHEVMITTERNCNCKSEPCEACGYIKVIEDNLKSSPPSEMTTFIFELFVKLFKYHHTCGGAK